MKNAVILGGGTYGEVFLTYLKEQGFNVLGFFDDKEESWGKIIHGLPVFGDFNSLVENNLTQKIHQVFCPIGDNKIRVKYLSKLQKLGFEIPNFIHSSVLINKDVKIGNGVYLLPGVIIMPHTMVKDFVIISMGSHVAHHTLIDEGSFISTGVNVGASIHIKKRAFLGISSTVMTGVKSVGKNAIVGSGAVVIRNVDDNHVVAGVPARTLRIRKIEKEISTIDRSKNKQIVEDGFDIVGYNLNCYNLETTSDIDKYKSFLSDFDGYNTFYKTELFSVKNSKNERLSYFIVTKYSKILIIMPFALRKIHIGEKDTTYYDVTSFYGYSGPLLNEDVKDNDIGTFWHLVDNWYKKNKVVTEFIRFNLEGNYKSYSGKLTPTLNNVKGVILQDSEVQWAEFPPKVRNNYRKAIANDLKALIFHMDIEEKIIETFHEIYISTMKRNLADDTYYFSLDYFKNFISSNPHTNIIIIIYKDHIPISTELILLNNDTMYSFLGGTISDYFYLRPNDFLKMEAMNWGRNNGYKNYILGGGRVNNDSLYKYKKSFFPKNEDAIYYTGRKIIDPATYEKLVTLSTKYSYKINEHDIINNYFPLYRK